MREYKPLEEMTREELIEEVQLIAVVRGEREAEMEDWKEQIAQLEQERDHLMKDIEEAAREYDAEIQRWKERCRQEIAFKVSVIEERDALRATVANLEQEHAALRQQRDQQ
jgi:hypothetical protein